MTRSETISAGSSRITSNANTPRQLKVVSAPPMIVPTPMPSAVKAPHNPNAAARLSSGTALFKMASDVPRIPAAPMP
jgi:hypothetical protein